MRNLIILALAIIGVMFALDRGLVMAAGPGESIALIPQPLELRLGEGQFTLHQDTTILVDKDSAAAMNAGRQLAERLRTSTGWQLKLLPAGGQETRPGQIRITAHGADTSLGREGYRLEVAPDGVLITAADGPGMFYGTQTLLQLLPPRVFSRSKVRESLGWTIPAVQIKDRPRFRWRGLLLDVARHFFNKEEVENFLDLMAQHKLNTLQLHLTDDEGWRIEIKQYPKLTSRKDSRQGGFYTQADIRELVAYAEARAITIVPEIEMPGHSGAAARRLPRIQLFRRSARTRRAHGHLLSGKRRGLHVSGEYSPRGDRAVSRQVCTRRGRRSR